MFPIKIVICGYPLFSDKPIWGFHGGSINGGTQFMDGLFHGRSQRKMDDN